jgi:hypothetical protein
MAYDLLNTDLVIIPRGMTSQLQVLDVVVNKPFKDRLRRLYGEWLLSGNCPQTPAGNTRRPSEAKCDQTKKVLVFDLQKTLPTPSLSTSVAYYKHQMWMFNLGIHDAVTATGYMNVWSDNIASRGAQEIGSCL